MTITTGQRHAEQTGEIAITTGHRTLLHLLRGPEGETGRTLCGRYPFARHTGRELVGPNTPRCQVCFALANGDWEQVCKRVNRGYQQALAGDPAALFAADFPGIAAQMAGGTE